MRAGAEGPDSSVDGNHVGSHLLEELRLLVAGDMAELPKPLDLAHLDQETLAAAWALFPDVLPRLRGEARDHRVVAEPVDSQRDSRSRNQRVRVIHSGYRPWDGHHWN